MSGIRYELVNDELFRDSKNVWRVKDLLFLDMCLE